MSFSLEQRVQWIHNGSDPAKLSGCWVGDCGEFKEYIPENI